MTYESARTFAATLAADTGHSTYLVETDYEDFTVYPARRGDVPVFIEESRASLLVVEEVRPDGSIGERYGRALVLADAREGRPS